MSGYSWRMAPPIFKPLTIDQAIEASKAEGRLVLVDFTSETCAPCKQMDAAVWVAPAVTAWADSNAIAVQVDVDASPSEAQRFGIRSRPTMVLLKNGAELDRSSGARPAAKLIEWLDNAKAGRTELDTARETLPDGDPSAWLHLGRMCLEHGKLDEALAQFERCWFHALEKVPAWYGVRLSYLVGELERLAQASPRAREAIGGWRDEAGKRLFEPDSLRDWLALNGVLGDDERVLQWLDGVKHPASEPIDLGRDRRVVELLLKHGRWADYGRLLKAPVAHFTERVAMYRDDVPFAKMSAEMAQEIRAHGQRAIRDEARAMVKALKAAGRSAEAVELEAKAVELDPTDEMRDALATA